MKKMRIGILIFIITALATLPIFAQEESEEGSDSSDETANMADFGLGLGIGVQNFDDGTYQVLSFTPDLAFGKIGVGVDFTIHYRFTGGEGNEFEIREQDWIPEGDTNFLELYLPKIRYLRYAQKGDPLYVKLGSIEDATLGNGFIMSNYANTHYLPEQRIFGMSFDVDGRLFNFPLVGVESFVGNLTAFDVVGGRLYVRPLSMMDIPILNALQVGGTMVVDTNPFYFTPESSVSGLDGTETALVAGGDFRLPLIANPVVSLATFGDLVAEGKALGGMLGFGGELFSFLNYGAQLRFLGDDFIPSYFDATYDLYRTEKLTIITNDSSDPILDGHVGWFASLGTSLIEDLIMLNVSIDGPFGEISNTPTLASYPHLRGTFTIQEGIMPGFSFDAFYDKRKIQSMEDLISPEDATIGMKINYKTGPAVISLVYDLKYNPAPAEGEDNWKVTSGLESSISLY